MCEERTSNVRPDVSGCRCVATSCTHHNGVQPVIGISLQLFHLHAENYTQNFRISLSVNDTLVITGCNAAGRGTYAAHTGGEPSVGRPVHLWPRPRDASRSF